MKKHPPFSFPVMGGSSLLTIFAVLCLTLFSLLSLTTARAEQRLALASAEAAAGWYRADSQAQEIFARLRGGEQPSCVREDNGTYTYTCPISQGQQLEVALVREGAHWQVLRWQAAAREQTGDERIPVWNAEGGTP